MFTNYLKIAFRNLFNHKVFSLINISGLAIGLAVFVLIIKWVEYEFSYNDFHQGGDLISAIQTNKSFANNEIATFPAVPAPLASSLMKDFVEIEAATTTTWGDQKQLAVDNKVFVEYGLYTDNEFLRLFTFPLIKGDKATALSEPNSIIITQKLANKYFGERDPMGKTILVERDKQYKITGVAKDIPLNATLSFDFLMPLNDYLQDFGMTGDNWDNSNVRAYLKLKPEANSSSFESKIKTYLHSKSEQQAKSDLTLWNLKDWYLRMDFKNGKYSGGGRIVYVRMFIIIAFFILALACINFMNLSTARATKRAKEVGIRKTIGAAKKSLIFQFISEAILISIIAGVVAIAIVYVTLPFFNTLLRKHIAIDFMDFSEWIPYAAIVLTTGMLAGSYPAFVLSSFRPIKVLKSLITDVATNTLMIRKVLVVSQFTVSLLLIIGTLIITKQVLYLKNKNLGVNTDKLIWFPNNIPMDKITLALNEIHTIPGVQKAAQASMTFSGSNNRASDVSWPGKVIGNDIFFSFIAGSHDLPETMGMKLKDGRSFSSTFSSDTGAYILNEEAVKRMGLQDPVGKIMETSAGSGTIVGVVHDFHFESLHHPIAPIIITCRPEWTWNVYVKLNSPDVQKTIADIEKVYRKFAPGFVFDYNFQDQEYDRLYRSENQIGILSGWFSGFAIFISCLGLLGLSLFMIERKAKEISIRKILGAGVASITYMVSKEFIALVFISIAIAIPVGYFLLNRWLGGFAYKINIEWPVFLLAGMSVISIALITIGYQAIKAAIANPVKSLRAE